MQVVHGFFVDADGSASSLQHIGGDRVQFGPRGGQSSLVEGHGDGFNTFLHGLCVHGKNTGDPGRLVSVGLFGFLLGEETIGQKEHLVQLSTIGILWIFQIRRGGPETAVVVDSFSSLLHGVSRLNVAQTDGHLQLRQLRDVGSLGRGSLHHVRDESAKDLTLVFVKVATVASVLRPDHLHLLRRHASGRRIVSPLHQSRRQSAAGRFLRHVHQLRSQHRTPGSESGSLQRSKGDRSRDGVQHESHGGGGGDGAGAYQVSDVFGGGPDRVGQFRRGFVLLHDLDEGVGTLMFFLDEHVQLTTRRERAGGIGEKCGRPEGLAAVEGGLGSGEGRGSRRVRQGQKGGQCGRIYLYHDYCIFILFYSNHQPCNWATPSNEHEDVCRRLRCDR
mmetsp:Transcript_18297/g.41815  ORF Transcript_18297/g.41815 Transcript_18297/m.41815 type:complete len:389 (+) Transcript_18297:2393-3559(+)